MSIQIMEEDGGKIPPWIYRKNNLKFEDLLSKRISSRSLGSVTHVAENGVLIGTLGNPRDEKTYWSGDEGVWEGKVNNSLI